MLAAKFSSDMKKPDISKLIEVGTLPLPSSHHFPLSLQEINDRLRVPVKELLVYEFPTLVALEFSLLTPVEQLRIHYDRIRELELS